MDQDLGREELHVAFSNFLRQHDLCRKVLYHVCAQQHGSARPGCGEAGVVSARTEKKGCLFRMLLSGQSVFRNLSVSLTTEAIGLRVKGLGFRI